MATELIRTPGIIAAALTPFTPERRLDVAALERQIDYLIEDCHAAAVSIGAVETAEYTVLSFEDRKELIRRGVAAVAGRVPAIVGVSHPHLPTAIALAHLAEEVGAAAVQALAPLRPWGGPPSTAEVVRYYEELARHTRLPIVVYLNPGPGAELSIATCIELSRLESVRYFKESSRDLRRVSRLLEEIDRAGHARYFTTMEMLLITLMLGGPGATMPPPAVRIGEELCAAFAAGDYVRAAELQRKFALFPARWIHYGLTPVMKAAMRHIGIDLGEPAPPYEGLSAADQAALAAELDRIGLTRAAARV
ncbi:MAG TPA: dihydrodipicolinate synthase family protein [Chloroflexota bacterium]|nr:dihydrodipicolinate synthase family protein [Chloroflexota bacterium]